MLKFVLTYSLLVISAKCGPFDKEKLETIGKVCRAQTGMDKQLIDKALAEGRLPEPTATYLKYIECSYRKQGYLKEEGSIDFDAIKDMLLNYYTECTLGGVLKPCKAGKEGDTPAERAYKAARCIVNGLQAIERTIENDVLLNDMVE